MLRSSYRHTGQPDAVFWQIFYDDKEDIWRGGIPKNCSVCIVEVKDGVGTVLEKDKIFYDEAE